MRQVKKAFERIAAKGGIPIVGRWAALYMTAVIEYMMAEVLELAGTVAVKTKKARQAKAKIDSAHVVMAFRGCVSRARASATLNNLRASHRARQSFSATRS